MTPEQTGTERQNAAGTGADANGIVTEDDETRFSDSALEKHPQLQQVMMRVPARPHLEAFGDLIPGTDLVPFYRGAGDLWYVANIATGESIYPQTAEARKMSRMTEGELAHYLADKKLGH